MSDENDRKTVFIQMLENSVKARELTDVELLGEICEAFSDLEIHSWKDALLGELMMRFQVAIRLVMPEGGLSRDGNKLAGWYDPPGTERPLENAAADDTIPSHAG